MIREILQRLFRRWPARVVPTRSPVPWVDDAVWADWSRYPVRQDGTSTGEPVSPIGDPVVAEVVDDDRSRAPQRRVRKDEETAPEGALDLHARLLRSTPPASGGTYGQFWPVCCRRLTTIIHCEGAGRSLTEIERDAGRLDLAFVLANLVDASMSPEEMREFRARGYADLLNAARVHGGDGYGILECRACGRTYVGTWEP